MQRSLLILGVMGLALSPTVQGLARVGTLSPSAPQPLKLQAPGSSESPLLRVQRAEELKTQEDPMRLKGAGKSMLASIKDSLFPVDGWEMPKFFSMSFMMFCIIYIYTTVRDTKDTLVISSCGAESITFLKVYGVLPAATMFMVLYGQMSNYFSKKALFYITACPFMVFYILFAWVLYPNRALIHPAVPKGIDERWQYPVALVCNWSYSLFYIISELWGSVGVSVLFWQFANDIIPVWQAKRFYPLFGQLANIAPICAGQTVAYFAKLAHEGDDSFGLALKYTTMLVAAAGVALLGIYYFVGVLDEADKKKLEAEKEAKGEAKVKKPKKPKMGMMESFKFLLSQRYLGYLCVLVVSYGLSINLTEVIWKRMVKQAYTNKKDYQIFMGHYSSLVGAATFIIIFFGSNIVKHMGWTVGALTTPILMGALSIPFFAFVLTQDTSKNKQALMNAVFIGMWQNILSKAIKYALFDPTKEMAYIPLDQESKVKGKAAIDVLAARIGKSGGSLVQQMIVIVFGNIIKGAGCVAAVFYATIVVWIMGVLGLAKMFEAKIAEGKKDKAEEKSGLLKKAGNMIKKA